MTGPSGLRPPADEDRFGRVLIVAAVLGFVCTFLYPTLHQTNAAQRRAGLELLPPGWTASPAVQKVPLFADHGHDRVDLLDVRPGADGVPLTVAAVRAAASANGWSVYPPEDATAAGAPTGQTERTALTASRSGLTADVVVVTGGPTAATLTVGVEALPRGRFRRSFAGAGAAAGVAALALALSWAVLWRAHATVAAATLLGVFLAGASVWAPALHRRGSVGSPTVPLVDPGVLRLGTGALLGLLLGGALVLALRTAPGHRLVQRVRPGVTFRVAGTYRVARQPAGTPGSAAARPARTASRGSSRHPRSRLARRGRRPPRRSA